MDYNYSLWPGFFVSPGVPHILRLDRFRKAAHNRESMLEPTDARACQGYILLVTYFVVSLIYFFEGRFLSFGCSSFLFWSGARARFGCRRQGTENSLARWLSIFARLAGVSKM